MTRNEEALDKYRLELANQIDYYKVTQYLFFSQWKQLKEYANKHHIKIIGDMPIYVSADSVEVSTNLQLFKSDSERKPLYVAGVPADNFSADGQLSGNPILPIGQNMKKLAITGGFIEFSESFKLYDVLRIDH